MSVLPKVIKTTKSKKKYLLFYGTLPALLTACIGWRRDPEPEDKQPATPAPNPTPAVPKPAAKDIATPDNDMIKLDGKILEVDALAGDDKVLGTAAAETINGGDGADLLRGGQGADKIYGGSGVDHIVLVGANSNGKYTIDDIKDPNGTGIDLSDIVTLAEVNDGTSDAEAGEVIDGGADGANLFIFGQVDLSQVTLSNVTQIQVQSTLTVTAQQILELQAQGLTKIIGDGTTEIIIPDSETAFTISLENLEISDLELLSVGKNVTLILDKEDIANIHIVEGDGVLQAANGTLEVADKKFQVNTKIFNEDGISESYMDIRKAAVGDVIDPIKVYELKDGESATYELYVHEGFDVFVDGQQLAFSGNADFKADYLQGHKSKMYDDVIGHFETYKGAATQTTLKYELTQSQLNKLELKANQGIEGYDQDSGSDTGFGVYSIVANITHKDGSTSKSIGGEMVAFGVKIEGSNDANNFYNPAQDHTLYFIDGKEGYNEILIDYNFSSAKFVLDKDGIWIFANENGHGGSDNHNSYHLKNIDKIGFKDLGIYSNQIMLEAIKPGGQSSDELYAWLKAHYKDQFKHEDVLSDGGKISGPVSDGDDDIDIQEYNKKIIQTGAGDDNVTVAIENQILMPGSGNDKVNALNAKNSAIFMGAGDDEIQVHTLANNNFNGGEGIDTAIFLARADINLSTQNESQLFAPKVNKFSNIEIFKIENQDIRLVAGSEDISVYGNYSDDYVTAKEGKVNFYAGSGNDRYDAGTGVGFYDGGDGTDSIFFSQTATLNLTDQSQNDGMAKNLTIQNVEEVNGSEYDDVFHLSSIIRALNAEGGDDIIHIGSSNGRIEGGNGDDLFQMGSGDVDILGGNGDDSVSYLSSGATSGVTVNLRDHTQNTGIASGDRFFTIETLTTTIHDDIIHSNHEVLNYNGNAGDDIFYSQIDPVGFFPGLTPPIFKYNGGDGEDLMSYKLISDPSQGVKVDLSDATKNHKDAYGHVLINIENVEASNGNDEIIGNDQDNKLWGLEGNDILHSGGGNNELYGGAGNDRIEIGEGTNIVVGGDGRDVVVLGDNLTISVTSDNFLRIAHTLDGQEHVNRVQSVENLISLTNPNTTLDLKDMYLSVGGFTEEQEYLDWLDGSYGYDTV